MSTGEGEGYYRTRVDARPYITLGTNNQFLHDGRPIRVVFRRSGKLSIGCTDVTIHALREAVRQFDIWVSDKEFVVQEGF